MDSRVRRGKGQVLGIDLLPHEDHNIAPPRGNDESDGLAQQHDKHMNAATKVKNTTTSSRNKYQIFACLTRSDR